MRQENFSLTRQPLISIIMPAYNAGEYIRDSIHSVLNQTYVNWELLIVNDGSTDNTGEIIKSFSDKRLFYFEKVNGGVSSARNTALANMRGDFFCFLDADDIMPVNSLMSRMEKFLSSPHIGMVDGQVKFVTFDLKEELRLYKPGKSGRVVKDLACLSEKVFSGITAMVRKEEHVYYSFDETMTHAEDLWFLLHIHRCSTLHFDYVNEPVIICRQRFGSAMSNLDGLGRGYLQFYDHVKREGILQKWEAFLLRIKIAKIMFLSYLRTGAYRKAFAYSIRLFVN